MPPTTLPIHSPHPDIMKKTVLVALLLLFLSPLSAQNVDSLRFVSARWKVDSLDGMLLKRIHFTNKDCIGSNQFLALLEIPPQSPRRLAFTYEPRRTPTSSHARKHNAVAAINGSFFDMALHNPICYLRIDGSELGVNTPQASDSIHRKYYQYGSLSLIGGHPVIFVPDSSRLAERTLPDSNIMTAGPLLIHNGTTLPMRTDKTFVTDRHNRTAIGVKPDGTVLLLVVDGRTKQSEGLSLQDLTRLMRWLGCSEALNLDGGGSTTMYVRNFPHGGLVNHPSDNGRFDFDGERTVSNCIIVK